MYNKERIVWFHLAIFLFQQVVCDVSMSIRFFMQSHKQPLPSRNWWMHKLLEAHLQQRDKQYEIEEVI